MPRSTESQPPSGRLPQATGDYDEYDDELDYDELEDDFGFDVDDTFGGGEGDDEDGFEDFDPEQAPREASHESETDDSFE